MIISNSTPLIYLAKIQRLSLLKALFQEVMIPVEVQEEVVEEGKRQGQPDAFIVEKEIASGWIKVEPVKKILAINLTLERGEKAALSLAKEQQQDTVLMDEAAGRAAAKILGLQPRGTIFVLLKALQQQHLTLDEFLQALTQLAQAGFRLREEIYMAAIEEAQRITKR